MNRQTFYLEDSQSQAVEDLSRESKGRDDVPSLSKSEVARRLLDHGLDDDPLVEDLVSEATRVKLREERYMTDEGDLVNKRTGFETQVKRHFKNRFQNGYRPEQLEAWAVNMRAKARAYWPADFETDYQDRRETALAYVDALLEEAKAAADASEYDPLDPSEVFAGYQGVEDGRGREDFAAVLEDARKRLRGGAADEDALARALSKKHGVTEALAREAIDSAQGGEAGA
jgi:hypothetical protein